MKKIVLLLSLGLSLFANPKFSANSFNITNFSLFGNSNNSSNEILNSYTKNIRCDKNIDKEVYDLCYNYKMNLANYVAYTLDGSKINAVNIKERPNFYSEKNLNGKYKVKTDDYSYTGFDRGHMAPDADFDYSKDTLDKTYSMANIVPQYPDVNRKTWETAEEYERAMAVKKGTVSVINIVEFKNSIPMSKFDFDSVLEDKNLSGKKLESYKRKFQKSVEELSDRNIIIPSGFYKVIYDNKGFEECYYFPNIPNPSLNNILSNAKINCSDLKR